MAESPEGFQLSNKCSLKLSACKDAVGRDSTAMKFQGGSTEGDVKVIMMHA